MIDYGKRRSRIQIEAGKRIKALRERVGATQAELGRFCKITRAQVSNAESGRGVSLETLALVAKALGVCPGDLLP